MKLGMVGLGRMGGNMTIRLREHGHEVQTYARSGGGTASSLKERGRPVARVQLEEIE